MMMFAVSRCVYGGVDRGVMYIGVDQEGGHL